MDVLLNPEILWAFVTLTILEIVLGIDNIIFISILTGRLPEHQRARGRIIGLGLAMIMRIALLFSLASIMRLTDDLFVVFGKGISGRDIILLGGGTFLIAKATREVHNSLEHETSHTQAAGQVSFYSVLVQIVLIDIVFSFDSVITALGLVDRLSVMVAAIVTAVVAMMLAAGHISRFVEDHPTIKMLALSFLILIGATLIGQSFDANIPKGYIYFAMAFSFGVEMLNLRARKKRGSHPMRLRKAQLGDLIPMSDPLPDDVAR
ncbi:MAG: TerC family protein [Gammaproteobacteria bacterium]|nr:TerC family protein [Gammaproteobacteria bacterium]